ncbi:MAG: DNA-methyltransferase [Solirubrobacterales bacterium]
MSGRAKPPMFGDLSNWALIQAESIWMMSQLPDCSIQTVVTDPPYWLAMQGKSWDGGNGSDYPSTPEGFQQFTKAWAEQVHRILVPGGHLIAAGASRTSHRLSAGIEDAGLEIRDSLIWLRSDGVPKGRRLAGGRSTGLKPAYEVLVMARKPLAKRVNGKPGTTLDNLDRFGTGAINVDETSVPRTANDPGVQNYWPANVVLSHGRDCTDERCVNDCAVVAVDRLGDHARPVSRIFHAGKALTAEREAGLDALEKRVSPVFSSSKYKARARACHHPTVKPLSVMGWAVRLVSPPGSVVLDPFAGTSSTGCAAMLAGRSFIGIERESDYIEISRARLAHWAKESHRNAS